MSADINSLLHLIKANPSLLPEAPDAYTAQDLDRRRLDGVHACLGCGARARLAYVAMTDSGPRYLDLCPRCAGPLYDDTP